MAQDLPDGTVGTDIIAQTIADLSVDITAQTLGQLSVNILACTPTININISSQTADINVNIAASAVTMDVSGAVTITKGTIETLNQITYIAGSKAIDTGMPATDRPRYSTYDVTFIDVENPADANGFIDTIEIWANTQLEDCKVGIMKKTGTNTFKCRSMTYIGDVTPGSKQTFTKLSLDVRTGDFLAIYFTHGRLEKSDPDDVTYPNGHYGLFGDYINPGVEKDRFDHITGYVLSFHGSASQYPLKTDSTYSGATYVNSDTATTDAARRFEAAEKKLRDAIIQVEDNTQLFGDSTNQTFPVVVGDRLPITQIDISTLYFKNAVAGQNGTVHILAVED